LGFSEQKLQVIDRDSRAGFHEAMKEERHAFCAECNGWFEVQNMVAYDDLHVCARCKPIFLQKLAEGAFATKQPRRNKLLLLVLLIIALVTVTLALVVPVLFAGH
jgi:uncharacterized paraquat-inducible protein A